MCTSLLYRDTSGGVYTGRTLELSMELPYFVAHLPAGTGFRSAVDGFRPMAFRSRYGMLAIVVPAGAVTDLKVVEGVNDQGLTFSLLAFAGAEGPQIAPDGNREVLSAIDLGAWTLGQFKDVDEVKAALEQQPVIVAALAALGGAKTPFHYCLSDRRGRTIVVEFAHGEQRVYDNPVGVMTNGPEFSWHLTNLNNYSFLSNQDKDQGQFGALKVKQPDSGISTVALPASNTSVGRFVKAAFYAQYAERAATPQAAITTLAHIMNNFDRPRGISIESPESAGEGALNFAASGIQRGSTEYTSWTSLTDLARSQIYLRSYDALNYSSIDLGKLAGNSVVRLMPLAALNDASGDVTELLLQAKAITQ